MTVSFSFFSFFVISLFLSAFFSLAEAACTGLNRGRLRQFADRNPKFQLLVNLLNRPQKLVVGFFVGQQLFACAAIVSATVIALDFLPLFGISNVALIMFLTTLVVSLWMVLFSDMFPRSVAFKRQEKMALFLARPIQFSMWVLTPFILIFEWIMQHVASISGHVYLDSTKLITADEIKNLVNMGEKEGVFEAVEKEMIHSIFEFSTTIVREVMTPRTDVISLSADITVQNAVKIIKEHGHSRIPVFEDQQDNIVGVIYAKDFLSTPTPEASIRSFVREPFFVPETQNILDLLHQMKKSKSHIAIVVDEYGGISGIVTLEDIIEEIIGEVQDEYDLDEKPEFQELSPGKYLVDAGMNIDDLASELQVEFEKDEDFDTIGGFVLSLLGKFPHRGEVVHYMNLSFKVKEISKRRILSLEISVLNAESEESDLES